MIDEDYFFQCPHCGADMSLRLDPSGGNRQQLIHDCETCCRPIQIGVHFEGDEVISFSAETGD